MKPTIIVAILTVLLWASPAAAENTDLGTFPVTPDAECTLVTANNVSVHTGNVLNVVNGRSGTIRIPNVEDVADESFTVVFTAANDVTEVTAFVELNPEDPDPFTSLSLTITCETPPVTTTTTTTTPPPPPTTPPPPTCVELGTCHPVTGGSYGLELYVLGLAAIFGVAGGFILRQRSV